MIGDGSFQISEDELDRDAWGWLFKIVLGLAATGIGIWILGKFGFGVILILGGWKLSKSAFDL